MWDVSVCVACLATDVRMYSMSASSLLQPYQLLAGIQLDNANDYLPQKLCWECAALVNKFNLFRHKCKRAYLLLQDIYNLHDEIIELNVNEIDRDEHDLSSSLSITQIPSYALTSPSVAVMKNTNSIEHLTCSVKPEIETIEAEYSTKCETEFNSSDQFMNFNVKGSCFLDDDDEKVVGNEKMISDSEQKLKYELNITKEEARPVPFFSGSNFVDVDEREGVSEGVEVTNIEDDSEDELKFELIVTKAEAPPISRSSGKEEVVPPDAWTEIYLTQEQVNQVYTDRKNSSYFKRATLKCELCYLVFQQQRGYAKHMLRHHPSSGSYECDFCKFRYKTRRVITRHLRAHMRKYKCNICSKDLNSRDVAKYHIRKHQKYGPVLRTKKSRQEELERREARRKQRADAKKLKLKLKKKEIRNEAMQFEAVVSVLTQEEMMAVVRERQLAKGYDTAPFKCHLCFKVFLENRTYSQHMTVHDPVRGEFECDICKIRLKSRRQVRDHINSSHLRKYTCNICSNVFYRRCVMQYHYQKHKGVKFVCHVCAATFSREPSMQLHLLKQHPSFTGSNVCGDCGTYFPTYRGLVCHKRQMHEVATVREENAPYCEECKVQFASRKAWTKHVLNSESHKDLQKDIANGCIQCGDTFHNNAALRRHTREHRPDKLLARYSDAGRSKPRWSGSLCGECGERVGSGPGHWAHYRRCHPGVPYPHLLQRHACEQCGQRFNTKALLEQHRVKHSGPPPLQCSICPKAFYMEPALQRHLSITHSEERPHKCDTCDQSFKIKSALKRHLMVHTGEKPFACNVCEKTFTERQWLQLHVRKVHNKEHIPSKPRVRKRKPPV